jgi:hypothetical protein
MEPGAFQLGDMTNRHYQLGMRVKVPRRTKRVFLPRRHHYSNTVLTEEGNEHQLETFYDDLEPCVVTRGLFGWGTHRCDYHLVMIEEEGKKEPESELQRSVRGTPLDRFNTAHRRPGTYGRPVPTSLNNG